MKNLGAAELEIMQIIWKAREPGASTYILSKLGVHRKWKLSTLMTSLNRLVKKGYLSMEKEGTANRYQAVISEKDYKEKGSKSLLENVYVGSFEGLVSSLVHVKKPKKEELQEILDMLKKEL